MRLLPFVDIDIVQQEQLSGPETVGASMTRAISGFTQSVASPFGAWVFRFTFKPMNGDEYVNFRGWVAAQHRGANATRWRMIHRDSMRPEAAGISYEPGRDTEWANGQRWLNGAGWAPTLPNVAVIAPAAMGATELRLRNNFWGHKLRWGHRLGIFPLHFGMYEITEVIGGGIYRIWPPLRKAISAGDFATLNPVMAMRIVGQDLQHPPEAAGYTIGASVTLMEVFDYDVRDYFTDSPNSSLYSAADG
jgi:hypothetical protein